MENPIRTGDDVTLGECYRLVRDTKQAVDDLTAEVRTRHHALTNQMTEKLGAVAINSVLIERTEASISDLTERCDDLDAKLQDVSKHAARLSGGIGMLAFLSSLVPWPWKH